ncbi:phosphotransferase [Saccharopolyspora erythraea]|uniref:aminoglycoside phosphotransferase family protein n=1 Tax=Saccharopolyspora erythraea TaxID=1836 RepID=UPI001BA98495|nr:aminoglycoside phosphotransferase family protein [Saccharopolyspora erythraea]QUH04926.1 phosphotransferase [Saccharopolyspora erythraea]
MDDLLPPDLPIFAEMRHNDSQREWLARLPGMIAELRDRWSVDLGDPIRGGSCSWVAPASPPDGARAVLKITWPHREMAGEAEALRLWDGVGAVRLIHHAPDLSALLVERCEPGTALAEHDGTPEELLTIAANALRDLWRPPAAGSGFERVADVAAEWADEVEDRMRRHRPGIDPGLVALGADLLRELPRTAEREVVVHGDFNPGNLLAAHRDGGRLAIDPKPMIGDPAYDPWPLLEQIDDPFDHDDPGVPLKERFALVADVLGEDVRRLQAWSVARQVETALWCVEHGEAKDGAGVMDCARVVADLAGL